MSSFYPRSGRRVGAAQRGYMSSGWSQPIFNMNPLDVISNFVSPILDIVSPLEDIKDLMNQGLRWYQRTPMQRLVQKQKRKVPTGKAAVQRRGQRLPQKYRIVIDCTGFNPNALRTNIKCVQDNKHLIVSSDMKKGRQFKRSFTLPKEVETKKMTKFVTPTSQLVIEFSYLDTAIPLGGISLQPKICQMPEGKCVHVNVPIGDFVDPNKVQLHIKGRDLIVRFEERIVPCGDSCSRVLYHNRVSLPQNVNVNVNAIKAKNDKHKLTILAPVTGTAVKGAISQQLHEIPVQHKMRHRKAKAVVSGVGVEKKVQPTITEKPKKAKKAPLETMPTKPEAVISAEKKPTISEKKPKQKKPSLLEKPGIAEKKKPEEKKPSILEKKPEEQKPTLEEKKPTAETLPGVTAEEKKKKKKKSKKLTATTTAMPTTTPTETATTATTTTPEEPKKEPSPISEERPKKEPSPVRSTESGADILKKVFETGGKSTSEQQGQESTTTTSASSSEKVPEEQQRIGATSGVQL